MPHFAVCILTVSEFFIKLFQLIFLLVSYYVVLLIDLEPVITGSIAQSATRRYLSYSEADSEVFRPTGATRCTNGGKISHGGQDRTSPPPCKFHPHRCNDKGMGPTKLKFLLRFYQNVEHKRPEGGIPCTIFTKFTEFVPHFRMR